MKKLLITLAVLMAAISASAENYILYTTSDGEILTLYNVGDYWTDIFGAKMISHTYEDGQGKILFDGEVTKIGYGAFGACNRLTSVEIPNSVTSIGEAAFSGAGLTSVKIPNSVTSIGKRAFEFCYDLTSVEIPNSVTTIGEMAFQSCTSLKSVEIPSKVTVIGDYTFSGCSGLTSVEIPNSVTSIGYQAFYSCSRLTSVKIPNSVTSIGYQAFTYCSRLTTVEIPNSVTSIGAMTFGLCSRLESFSGELASDDHRCIIIDGVLIAFAPAGLTSYVIPNSVTEIGSCAFAFCSALTSVVIPNSVTDINETAFSNCYKLATVTSLSTTPPVLKDGVFTAVDKNACVVKVPAEAVEAYKSADQWKEFQNIVGLTDAEIEALSIPTLSQNPKLKTQNLFNLQGQEVGEDYRGIVIRGGKKMLRK